MLEEYVALVVDAECAKVHSPVLFQQEAHQVGGHVHPGDDVGSGRDYGVVIGPWENSDLGEGRALHDAEQRFVGVAQDRSAEQLGDPWLYLFVALSLSVRREFHSRMPGLLGCSISSVLAGCNGVRLAKCSMKAEWTR